jgi:molecular chaperone DnaK (HSP70)
MAGRLAIDFGTSNTVISMWDETLKEGVPLHVPEYGHYYQQGEERISVVPSLIHYTLDNRRWLGEQVYSQHLVGSDTTFRWMKRYISHRSPMRIRVGDKDITPFEAGKDFLSTMLVFASQQIESADEEVALTVPVESYEHYDNWLASVAESSGLPRYRLIDEPSAAALGYGAHIQPGQAFLIFDFGGGTLHAAVVLVEQENNINNGRRCRVLGKAGRDIGGSSIDQWIFQELLRQNNCQDFDEDIRPISNILLVESERIKEQLSGSDSINTSIKHPVSGREFNINLTRTAFEEMLEQHDLYTEINRTVRAALNASNERGYSEDNIQSVLMIGGSSQIPSVQKTLRQIFGKEAVKVHRPLDAVARGAAAFVAGVDFYDHIQHDYAIRFINREKGDYDYKVIVQRGTPYPTEKAVARLAVRASYNGQEKLGIQIYELGQQRRNETAPIELIFDPTGAARLIPVSPSEQEQRARFWMNEQTPTFLVVGDTDIKQGDARFEVEFKVDINKRLTITARDIKSGQLVLVDHPVVRLT